jgi:hypothetical protein
MVAARIATKSGTVWDEAASIFVAASQTVAAACAGDGDVPPQPATKQHTASEVAVINFHRIETLVSGRSAD